MSPPLPASQSKHLAVIPHALPRFPNVQVDLSQWDGKVQAQHSALGDTSTAPLDRPSARHGTGTTGTTLWLGAQVLACYILSLPRPSLVKRGRVESGDHPRAKTIGPQNDTNLAAKEESRPPQPRQRQRAVELGAGIGLLSLALAWHGYNVTATDIEPVVSTVLEPNISAGVVSLQHAQTSLQTGTTVISGQSAASHSSQHQPSFSQNDEQGQDLGLGQVDVEHLDWTTPPQPLHHPIDLIVTSDTIYNALLVPPLFKTISDLSKASSSSSLGLNAKPPMILLALERRDSRMVDEAIRIAAEYSVILKRVGHGRIAKAVDKAGWGWKSKDWEDVEIWKGRWSSSAGKDVADDEL